MSQLQNIVMKKLPPLSNHVQCLNAWLAYLQALDTKAVKNTSYFFRKMLWIVLGRKIVLYVGVNIVPWNSNPTENDMK